ncbi:AAA-ATPase At3g28610-like [Lolium rigidum]|uniref:AAA-ATPase At3g28610-like n=1 Tax=Lolium rigidum TaxID=89674 RepID=UPI001F5DA975|nr:AAA-ATPase At3g28610-like [Lolium rigidum]
MWFRLHVRRPVRRLLPFLDPFITVDIASIRYDLTDKIKSNDAFEEVKAYLSTACSREARQLCAEGAADGSGFVISLRDGEEVADEFRGITIWWSAMPEGNNGQRCCRLTFHERHRKLVVDEYLPHVRESGRDAMSGNRRRRLYTNKKHITYSTSRKDVWSYIDFDHPTTFDTLAMNPTKKQKIIDDLDDFRGSKEYYRRIGKAWKRGYLLYGPPGTGKSTMIAAMANYLNYDIYDIELTTLADNNDLRKLFIETTGKSIIVIEDIDCSLDLTGSRAMTLPTPMTDNKKRKWDDSILTLSGLLNFIDGLWSSAHSGERIIVFTTNHLDKLDAALIRRGRMDMHVEMSYCQFEAFKTLAKNYLGVDAHPLFDTIKELLQTVQITPADVAECLMASKRNTGNVDSCISRLIDELRKKIRKNKTSDDYEDRYDKTQEDQQEKEGAPLKRAKKDNVDAILESLDNGRASSLSSGRSSFSSASSSAGSDDNN